MAHDERDALGVDRRRRAGKVEVRDAILDADAIVALNGRITAIGRLF